MARTAFIEKSSREAGIGTFFQHIIWSPIDGLVNSLQQDITSATTPALVAGEDVEITTATANFTQLDVPRVVSATLTDTDGGITSGYVIVRGIDFWGNAVSDKITLGATTVEVDGTQVFRRVDTITIRVEGVVSATVDTVELGWTNKLGLPRRLGAVGDLLRVAVGNLQQDTTGDPWTTLTQASSGTETDEYVITATSMGQDWFIPGDVPDSLNDYLIEGVSTWNV